MRKTLTIFVSILLIFFLSSSKSSAQWDRVGPYGGAINDFAVVPSPDGGNYMFAATEKEIFRSTNNGTTWIPLYPNFGIYFVLHLASIGTTIFAGTDANGVYSSTDFGITWTHLTNGISDSYIWYLFVLGTDLFVKTDNGIFLTTDKGISWTDVDNVLPASQLMCMVSHETDYYAGTYMNGLLHSTDNGISWTKMNSLPSNRIFYSLAFNGDMFFAGTDTGVYYSTDKGVSWLFKGLPGIIIYNFVFDGPNIFTGNYKYGVYLSTDLGASWNPANIGLSNVNISALIVIGKDLYAGTEGNGVYLSTNNGTSWSSINDGLAAIYINTLFSSDKYLFADYFRLSDDNTTWIPVNVGLVGKDSSFVFDDLIQSFAFDGNNLFSGSWNAGVFRSTNYGANWTAVNNGLPHYSTATDVTPIYSLAVSGNYIFTGDAKGVHRSSDLGENWAAANNGLMQDQIPEVHSLAVLENDIFAGTYGYGLFHSTDNGSSWSFVKTGLPNGNFTSLAINHKNLFATASGIGVLLSTDNGESWVQLNNGLPNTAVGNIVLNDSNIFLTAGNRGVFLSTNNGLNWIDVNNGLMDLDVSSIAVHGSYLYAATHGNSVWRRPLVDFGLPVELTNFTCSVKSTDITLKWKTATELNTSKFEIERKSSDAYWNKIGEIEAAGNSTSQKSYSYTDSKLSTGRYSYRLKMIDLDGTFKYSNEIQADISIPREFNLSQNYPNPFNPNTTINYSLPGEGNVKLTIYNVIGSKVATIVDEYKPAGNYSVQFNGSNLASGIYMYKLEAGIYSASKKLIILK